MFTLFSGPAAQEGAAATRNRESKHRSLVGLSALHSPLAAVKKSDASFVTLSGFTPSPTPKSYLLAGSQKTAVRSFMVPRSSWPPRAPLRRRPRHSGRTMDPASGCHLWRPPVVACRIRTRARKQRGHEWHSRGGFALDALRCVGDGPCRCQMAFGDVEVPLAPSSDQYTHPHYLPHHHHPHRVRAAR